MSRPSAVRHEVNSPALDKKKGLAGNIGGKMKAPVNVMTPSVLTPTSSSLSIPTFELSRLGDDSFDVEVYVRTLLQKLPNEDAVQQLHLSLADAKDSTSGQLQKNVYKNYNEFVIISKEISKLEGDMIAVRGILNEVAEIRQKFKQYSGAYSTVTHTEEPSQDELNKQRAREEAELEMKIEQMKALYRDIDGLSKSLPESPSRFVIHNGTSTRISEINPNTFKAKDSVYIHVFTDSLIICCWKKNVLSGKNRLTVDKVFNITEIGFIDMKDSPGTDTFMYKAETLQEKRTVLNAITKLTNEIVAQKKQQLENLKKMQSVAVVDDQVEEPTVKKVASDGLSDTDFHWLIEIPDELDVLIAHRDFDQAVVYVEKGETQRLKILRSNIQEKTHNLAKLISLDLTSPAATKSQIQQDIERLLRLGLGDQARDAYLDTRSVTIRHRLRQLYFNGDIVSFVVDYSEVFFRLIRNTCEWFSVSFHNPGMASGFMKWIQKELHFFTSMFRKHMHSIGMDLSTIFENLINDDLAFAIDAHAQKCDEAIFQCVQRDTFEEITDNTIFQDTNITFGVEIPVMSSSAYDFYSILTSFGSDIGFLLNFSLYNTIVTALGKFFKTFIDGLLVQSENLFTIEQYLKILVNSQFIADHVYPITKAQLMERFDRTIPELDSLQTDMQEKYNFVKMDYAANAQLLDSVIPSETMISYCKMLKRKFGFGGVQMFVLDINFLLKVFENEITDESNELANSLCERALRLYFQQNKDLATPLKVNAANADGRVL
ncbi:exocyst complex component exo84 [Boothiomyces macroporosus]|uniref:Exocyst complex component EXO84 n=1 Tax=Boothiomyces macroporosus TaxID=261099 RepID=A0AAD5UE20_9FUNG|nr:exocyst complex component exo84 [Boothiomyces macroporosus]